MKLTKTPLAFALTLALAAPMAMAQPSVDDHRQTHEAEEEGYHAQADRPDVLLLTKVKSKLAMSDTVSALDINVDVEDDVVELRGTVDNQAQADEAVRLARETVGVETVRSHLVINPTATDEQKDRNMESPEQRRERQEQNRTNRQDRAQAAERDRLDRMDMENQRRNDRNEAADRARMDRDDADMNDVERPDAWVLTKVKSQFLASSVVGALDINVDVDDGVARLNGEVATRAEAAEAERIARETEGVKRVESNLRVTGE